MCERRSVGRFCQESWAIRFESFPAATNAEPNREENQACVAASGFASSESCRGVRDSARTTNKSCSRRKGYSYDHCDAGFSCSAGKSKRRYAVWNSGARPQRNGHQSLFTRRELRRRQRLSAWIRCERPIHRKGFPGPVNLFNRCGRGNDARVGRVTPCTPFMCILVGGRTSSLFTRFRPAQFD